MVTRSTFVAAGLEHHNRRLGAPVLLADLSMCAIGDKERVGRWLTGTNFLLSVHRTGAAGDSCALRACVKGEHVCHWRAGACLL